MTSVRLEPSNGYRHRALILTCYTPITSWAKCFNFDISFQTRVLSLIGRYGDDVEVKPQTFLSRPQERNRGMEINLIVSEKSTLLLSVQSQSDSQTSATKIRKGQHFIPIPNREAVSLCHKIYVVMLVLDVK